jgi:lysophospholipid hydrolase
LTGRLRSIKDNADTDSTSFEIMGEHGPSESVGELEVLIDAPRPATIHAIRDSEVAVMPKSLFNALAVQHPEIMMTISRMIALRSKQVQDHPKNKTGSNNENLKTVAFIPISKEVPILDFAENLQNALYAMNVRSRFLDTRAITSQLGRHAFTKLGRLKLISWLAEQEEHHRLVMYIADGGINSPWTQRCIRQADCIIVVGCGDGDSSISEYEQLLLSMKTTARKELVLLHPTRFCTPGSTARWLKLRLWIHAHHHIQMKDVPGNNMKPSKNNTTTGNLGEHFSKFISDTSNPNSLPQGIYPNIYSGPRSDFSRLARRLLSRSIGLVLGGGGARGLSHAGIIRAFEENGLPFDYIGGTSMGAFIGGVYARENDHVSVYGRTKNFCRRMCSTWRMAIDLTYPIVSMTSGHEFNMCVWKVFFS